jgi:hypothetical protein
VSDDANLGTRYLKNNTPAIVIWHVTVLCQDVLSHFAVRLVH